MEDLVIQYDTKTLPAINLKIRNGDRVVLQGPNGCGKSSLIKAVLQAAEVSLRILPRIRYSGKLECAGGLTVSYVSQDTGHLRGGLREYAEERGLDMTLFLTLLRKLDFSRLQFEKKMENYSKGEKKKALIAASLSSRAHLYIWDEPLNDIDVFSCIQIENLILESAPAMLIAEHDKTFLDKIATKVINYEEVIQYGEK